ncbi:ABC transporter permease [Brachybacterium sacelli]|uniref:Osmoprotectant transport system permease protein n=1 Tax=Brachybacterium sacelli TaxID=173364 RepID=A0ABS4WZ70_9MICO|nr:ABC transporter permease [Brachybacterium sacelli]MBP2381497.1 osmoprotectant transport system permease protein [Brachybacterium sacelli]
MTETPLEDRTSHAQPPASKKTAGALGAGWRALLIQLVVILAAVGAVLTYVGIAPLSDTERSTLNAGSLRQYTLEHLELTFLAALLVLVIAIPLGVLLTRPAFRRASGPVIAVANAGQAAPSIGLVVLLAALIPSGFWAAILALVVYSTLPVLRNTMVGLRGVDQRLVEAGRGMGMSSAAVLFRIELPLAVPVMLAGVRTALVLLVGTAALATFINGGGLGVLITTGVNLDLNPVLIVGALLIALLALLIDWLGRVAEHVARPRGL